MPTFRIHHTGRIEARETVKIAGRPKRLSGWGESQSEAAHDLQSKISGLSKEEPKEWTFRRFTVERYFPTIEHLSDKWRAQVAWALDGHLYPAFGSLPLGGITRHQAQVYFNGKFAKLSRASVGHLRKVLFAVLALAEADGIIPSNPIRMVKLPQTRAVERDTYSPQEVGKLLQNAEGPVRDFIVLAACLGLRAGEAAGVRWKRGDKILRVKTSKTRAGVRSLPIEPGMLSSRGCLPPGWKWVARAGNELKDCSSKAELRYISPHGLRRSFAANLRKLNCPEDMRKDLMGHAGDVQRRYSGEWEVGARRWIKKLWKEVGEKANGKAA